MVDSVAIVALETLRDLLVEETKRFLSVRGEVEQVKRDLRSIHAMLMKADRKGNDSPTLKEYVNQLKDLAFEAEIVLERYAVKVASKKEGQSLKEKLKRYSCILCECSNVHELGRDVTDIISRLAALTGKFESELGQENSRHKEEEEDLTRQTLAHEVEPHFVGMEKEIQDLVRMVKDERRRERVIKIYGMGGLGKTTLARKVYNHADLGTYARAWACITQNFQAKTFLGNILRQLEENNKERHTDIDSMDVGGLMDRVYRFLEQRKESLLVIDDIWRDDHWDSIKKVVPTNCNVLLTTRNRKIASQESHSYELKLLTEDQGWDLLKKISLAPPDETGLENIGRDIVVKCGCLPLSISVIGGILRQKEHTSAEWNKVDTSIEKGSYLSHGEGVEEYKRVEQVLKLSYDSLPYYLKSCFLYLACFPEDQEIETETLYLLWMAEGFISHEDKGRNESLRDVAERYLSELAMRCMVQTNNHDGSPFNKFDSCRLHDLMHDLCSSKAEKENLLKRLEVSNISSPIAMNSINRLAIINDGDTHKSGTKGLEQVKDLRSFMLLKKDRYSNKIITFEDITIDLEKSPCLRILVVEGCEFEDKKLPDKVAKLIHLRYLSLRDSLVGELPKFVCGMPYLQTLDLRVYYSSEAFRLHNEIWKMKKLKHLFLPIGIEVIGGEKLRLDGLNELETLDEIDSETVRIADIPNLMSIRKLYNLRVGDMDSMSTVLQLMSNNNKSRRSCELDLIVKSCDLSRDVLKKVLMFPSLYFLLLKDCNVSGGFPCYEQGMGQNLVHLKLQKCKVRREDMNVNVNVNVMEGLGNYPILQTLDLYRVVFANAETFICPSNSFPQLEFLVLRELPNIKKWEVEEGAMPKLVDLYIDKCRNLEKVPNGLRFISTLQRLSIWNMPEEFKERVRGQDSATVSHIPHITYRY